MQNIYRTTITTPKILRDSHHLQNRWSLDKTELIRHCIEINKPIPSIFPDLNLSFYNTEKNQFLDLRGINLSDMNIGEVDLAYCVLDYANFSYCSLNKTQFQYSRMISVDFSYAQLNQIQMSPIDAMHANFNNAVISHSFMMASNLDFIEKDNIQLINTDLETCSMREVPK